MSKYGLQVAVELAEHFETADGAFNASETLDEMGRKAERLSRDEYDAERQANGVPGTVIAQWEHSANLWVKNDQMVMLPPKEWSFQEAEAEARRLRQQTVEELASKGYHHPKVTVKIVAGSRWHWKR